MAKQKKKRTKAYTGPGAVQVRPSVTRLSAANRSRAGQWLHDRRQFVKPVLIGVGILLAVIILGIGIVDLIVAR
jgi:hypothetical protein